MITMLLCLSAFLLSLLPRARALTLTVPAGKEMCVYFDVGAASQKVFGSFQVASGGFLDIDLKVSGPSGVTGYTAVRKTNDRLRSSQPRPGSGAPASAIQCRR